MFPKFLCQDCLFSKSRCSILKVELIGQLISSIMGTLTLVFFSFWMSVNYCLLLFFQNGSTALQWAALSEFEGMEKMKFLVEHGANVNIQREVGTNFSTTVCERN